MLSYLTPHNLFFLIAVLAAASALSTTVRRPVVGALMNVGLPGVLGLPVLLVVGFVAAWLAFGTFIAIGGTAAVGVLKAQEIIALVKGS